jgi:hypothetical protein
LKFININKRTKALAEWLPDNIEFIKNYALIWIQIKKEWELTADNVEIVALKNIFKDEPNIIFPVEEPEAVCSDAQNSTIERNPFSAPVEKATNIVKKSKSGICHDHSSRWFKTVKNFVAYETLDKCLDSGGRLPR